MVTAPDLWSTGLNSSNFLVTGFAAPFIKRLKIANLFIPCQLGDFFVLNLSINWNVSTLALRSRIIWYPDITV